MIKVISFRNDKKKEYAKFVLDADPNSQTVEIYNSKKEKSGKPDVECSFDNILDVAKLIDKRFKPF